MFHLRFFPHPFFLNRSVIVYLYFSLSLSFHDHHLSYYTFPYFSLPPSVSLALCFYISLLSMSSAITTTRASDILRAMLRFDEPLHFVPAVKRPVQRTILTRAVTLLRSNSSNTQYVFLGTKGDKTDKGSIEFDTEKIKKKLLYHQVRQTQ